MLLTVKSFNSGLIKSIKSLISSSLQTICNSWVFNALNFKIISSTKCFDAALYEMIILDLLYIKKEKILDMPFSRNLSISS